MKVWYKSRARQPTNKAYELQSAEGQNRIDGNTTSKQNLGVWCNLCEGLGDRDSEDRVRKRYGAGAITMQSDLFQIVSELRESVKIVPVSTQQSIQLIP